MDLTKKPEQKTAWKNIVASQSYGSFCDTHLHAYVWHAIILIVVFSTLRLETLCTFSHEPPQIKIKFYRKKRKHVRADFENFQEMRENLNDRKF